MEGPSLPARHAETRMHSPLSPVSFRRATRLTVSRDHLLHILEISLDPLMAAVSLWFAAWWISGVIAPGEVVLSLLVFALTFPGGTQLARRPWSAVRHTLLGWLVVSALLYALGYATGYLRDYDPDVLVAWWWLWPSSQLAAHFALRLAAPRILDLQSARRSAVIIGMNDQSAELMRHLASDPYLRVDVAGVFDDRSEARFPEAAGRPRLGGIHDVAKYVADHATDVIYIALPMASQPRIQALLEALHDTTASIYFVPDLFVSDLIQGRMDSVNGLPVIAVCESPLTGLNGVLKRASDIVLSLVILAGLSPLLLSTAIAVKLTSRGPVIFRQRRYGLDGREIIIWKFRSMTVAEDGEAIRQARPGDARLTPIGAFLRHTSLDELPQFFNVLQGRMSIVGPRPHAVAHNEQYRKLIRGYMVRHKIRPGITGWAQVNGYRGETETLEKMKKRVDFDLDYLRNWSLRFDLYIVMRTIWTVTKGDNAY